MTNPEKTWASPKVTPEPHPHTEDDNHSLEIVTQFFPNHISNIEMSNTKAGNAIMQNFDAFRTGQVAGVDIGTRGESVTVPITVTVANGVTIPSGYELSELDQLYIEAASTIVHQGTNAFELKKLINVAKGNDTNASVDEKTQNEVLSRLLNLSASLVRIDTRQHQLYNGQNKHKSQHIQGVYQGPILPIEAFTKDDGTTILSMAHISPLLAYGADSAQQITVPKEILDLTTIVTTGKTADDAHIEHTEIKNMTPQIMSILHFLIKQVARIRGINHGKSGTVGYIKYESIYTALERGNEGAFDRSKKTSKQRVNQNITKVCNVLVKKGYIKAATTEKRGRTQYYRLAITLK